MATDAGITTNTEQYRAARDRLVASIGDYEQAVDSFSWPRLTEAFNWATDWFDVIARSLLNASVSCACASIFGGRSGNKSWVMSSLPRGRGRRRCGQHT